VKREFVQGRARLSQRAASTDQFERLKELKEMSELNMNRPMRA
jgi:hypothetical protein